MATGSAYHHRSHGIPAENQAYSSARRLPPTSSDHHDTRPAGRAHRRRAPNRVRVPHRDPRRAGSRPDRAARATRAKPARRWGFRSFDDAAPPGNELVDKDSHYSNTYFQEDVSWLSDVGLEGDQKTGGLGVLKGTIAGDAWDIYGNLRNADYGEALFGVAGVGASVADAIKDPFGFAGTQVAKWMLEHIEPLRQAYEELSGNPTIVEAYTKSWQEISDELSTTKNNWLRTIETDIATWSGSAGDAYRDHAKDVLTAIDTAAAAAAVLSKLMEMVSKFIAIVRDLVRDIIAALLGAAIGYTIELAVTAGAAAGHVIASFLAKLAKSSLDTMTYLKKLKDVICSFDTYREPLAKILQNATSLANAWLDSRNNEGEQPVAAT